MEDSTKTATESKPDTGTPCRCEKCLHEEGMQRAELGEPIAYDLDDWRRFKPMFAAAIAMWGDADDLFLTLAFATNKVAVVEFRLAAEPRTQHLRGPRIPVLVRQWRSGTRALPNMSVEPTESIEYVGRDGESEIPF
jgi:hypothetical protein